MENNKNKKDNHYFKIHFDEDIDEVEVNRDFRKENVNRDDIVRNNIEKNPVEKQEKNSEKRTAMSIIISGIKQLAFSALIMGLGILVLNWHAYFQIAKSTVDDIVGNTQVTKNLEEITKELPTENNIEVKVDQTPEGFKKDIPDFNMEIAPPDNRLIIPRIDQNIPVVKVSSEALIKKDWNALEKDMQKALKDGVVHYPGTSLPGQTGNIVITGHSSYFPWDPGRFKDVFALLHKVIKGDRIVMYWNQKKYLYEVTDIKVVSPSNIEVLKQTPNEQLTLITCTPVGTNLKRLIVVATPVKEDQVRR